MPPRIHPPAPPARPGPERAQRARQRPHVARVLALLLLHWLPACTSEIVNHAAPGGSRPDDASGPRPDDASGPAPDGDGGPAPDSDGGPAPDGDGGPAPDGDGGPAPDVGCTPSCAGRVCGDDGCDGSCGTCASGQSCTAARQCRSSSGGAPYDPANPNATAEARQLLGWLYSIQGTKTLSGQHTYVGTNSSDGTSSYMESIHGTTGKYPAVYGSDFGFAANGGDGIDSRPSLLKACIKYDALGSVIKLMWHMCRPIDAEPCSWSGSVQAHLTTAQWNDLLTPGTQTYNTWAARMDMAAGSFKQLEAAKIPVVWRPYHEMNGSWFWWGGDAANLISLWRQTFDYLTNVKGVNNLIWVWGPNQWMSGIPDFRDFYPGDAYVDVLGADFYQAFYPLDQYDELLSIGTNRLIAITEGGFVPTSALLDQQPKWSFFYMWAGYGAASDINAIYGDPRVITADEVSWRSYAP